MEQKNVIQENEESVIQTSHIPTSPLTFYQIKWVKWKQNDYPIITQNENGPCPLIALSNALLLKEKFTIPNIIEIITPEQLNEYIADYILTNKPENLVEDHLINYEQNVQDALSFLPKLQMGMDVNIRFTGPKDFEYTPECIIFDLLNIPLCHGWIVDPINESDVSKCFANLTYNQILDKIVLDKHSLDKECQNTALLMEKYLQDTSHQLTYYGLSELASVIKEDEMVVLFRNNHFCTLTKHKDDFFTLVTDQGYLNEKNVMWETLKSVEGDETFVNSLFQQSLSVNRQKSITSTSSEGKGKAYVDDKSPDNSDQKQQLQNLTGDSQVDNDYFVALSLQNEEQSCKTNTHEKPACLNYEQMNEMYQNLGPVPDELMTDIDLAKKLQAEEDYKLAEEISNAEQGPMVDSVPLKNNPHPSGGKCRNDPVKNKENTAAPQSNTSEPPQIVTTDEESLNQELKRKCIIS